MNLFRKDSTSVLAVTTDTGMPGAIT